MAFKKNTKVFIHDNRIEAYLSKERLNTYRKFTSSGETIKSIEVYVVTQMYSSYLFLSLQFLEVSLRNAVYFVLCDFFRKSNRNPMGCDPEQWLFWLPSATKTIDIIKNANNLAQQEIKARPVRIGDIISRLSFGVWVSILSEQPNVKSPLHFWIYTVNKIFPNAPKRKQQAILHRLKEINLIRNRLFHYEPVWDTLKCETSRQIIEDLYGKYNHIMNTIQWITKDTYMLLDALGYKQMMDDLFDRSIKEVERVSRR
jgi:hypothetical protein